VHGADVRANGADGIALVGTANAPIRNTSTTADGGLGIDLGDDGVAANDAGDADSGRTALQNFRVLTTVRRVTGGLRVIGSLAVDGSGGSYELAFFGNAACDASGNGEGAEALGGFTLVMSAGSPGTAAFDHVIAGDAALGAPVTATATHANKTSELSACATVTEPATVVTLTETSKTVVEGAPAVFTVHRAGDTSAAAEAPPARMRRRGDRQPDRHAQRPRAARDRLGDARRRPTASAGVPGGRRMRPRAVLESRVRPQRTRRRSDAARVRRGGGRRRRTRRGASGGRAGGDDRERHGDSRWCDVGVLRLRDGDRERRRRRHDAAAPRERDHPAADGEGGPAVGDHVAARADQDAPLQADQGNRGGRRERRHRRDPDQGRQVLRAQAQRAVHAQDRPGRCTPKAFFKATGTATWSFKLERRFRPGSYRIYSRATAADGTVEAPPARVRVRVRR